MLLAREKIIFDIKSQGLVNVADIIIELSAGYCETYGFEEPAEINNGMCEAFAKDLCELIPGAQAFWNDEFEPSQDSRHCFILYCSRYYDSECPEGVTDWNYLPYFREQ